MNTVWNSPLVLIGGLVLLYATLVLLITVVFRSRRVIDIQRRQPKTQNRPAALIRFMDATKGVIDSRLGIRSQGPLSQGSLDAAGLKKPASDYVVITGVVVLISGVLGISLGGLILGLCMCLVSVVGVYAALLLPTQLAAEPDSMIKCPTPFRC